MREELEYFWRNLDLEAMDEYHGEQRERVKSSLSSYD